MKKVFVQTADDERLEISMRADGLYLRCAIDVDEWVVTSTQRAALRFSSLYAADICADGIGDPKAPVHDWPLIASRVCSRRALVASLVRSRPPTSSGSSSTRTGR